MATAAVAASGGVSATQAASGNKTYAVTGIQVSGDAAALVTIESPAATVLWRKRFAAAFNASENFGFAPIKGAAGAAVLVKISANTTNAEANIEGYTLP